MYNLMRYRQNQFNYLENQSNLMLKQIYGDVWFQEINLMILKACESEEFIKLRNKLINQQSFFHFLIFLAPRIRFIPKQILFFTTDDTQRGNEEMEFGPTLL